jgi:hypothetical protein
MAIKFNNEITKVENISFHSKKEAQRYIQLKQLEEMGIISDLELQPKFDIIIKKKHICFYIADFRYKKGRKTFIEDVKGFKTKEYIIKKKAVEALYNIKIIET